MIRVFFVLLMLVTLMGFDAQSQESAGEQPYDEAREAEIAQKAKKRIYPGGRDEEDLKVQSQLSTPPRKVSPQTDLKEEHTDE